jgi:hypothetical protein
MKRQQIRLLVPNCLTRLSELVRREAEAEIVFHPDTIPFARSPAQALSGSGRLRRALVRSGPFPNAR